MSGEDMRFGVRFCEDCARDQQVCPTCQMDRCHEFRLPLEILTTMLEQSSWLGI